MNTERGTFLPCPVSAKNVLKESSSTTGSTNVPSGWMPCYKLNGIHESHIAEHLKAV